MQVTLTPQDPKDSPMTFELEEGGSISLGSPDSESQLSWDLLPSHFRTRFERRSGDLVLHTEGESGVTLDNQPIEQEAVILSGQSLQMGELICQVSLEIAETTPVMESDDDIFGSGSHAKDQAIESPVKNIASVSVNSSRWLFKVLTGANAGAQMGLEDGKVYTVGSDSQSCDIVLTDLSVSKQHLKLSVFASGEMVIEDLKSRNGVLINGEKIEEKSTQTSSAIITAGATTFMVVDRTTEQKTIVTPTLPLKERVVKDAPSNNPQTPLTAPSTSPVDSTPPVATVAAPAKKRGPIRVIAAATSLCLLLGFGLYTLFDEKVVAKEAHPGQAQEIASVLEEYPYFEYSFDEGKGVLSLTGHILTVKDKRQLLSKLSQIGLIRRIDDTNLIVDEIVWQQFNMALEKNFAGINLSAAAPGEFVLSGTLASATQAEALNRYLQVNFPYNDNLQNQVVILDQLLNSINEKLQSLAPGELLAELNRGELLLVGTIPSIKSSAFQALVDQIKSTPGIRSIRNLVTEQNSSDDAGMLDMSSNYQITGYSKSSDTNTSVMINGRILQRGDLIDGMTIVSIRPKLIILERDGIKYRINYKY